MIKHIKRFFGLTTETTATPAVEAPVTTSAPGEAPRWLMYVLFGILLVTIAILLSLDFIFYSKKKGWFSKYEPPIPENSVQPNHKSSESTPQSTAHFQPA